MEGISFYLNGVHFRLERVRCGKPGCRTCPHGPYWYAYSRTGAFLKKSYVGLFLPDPVVKWGPEWVAMWRRHES